MPTRKRIGDLEISQDLAYQRREWLFERIGWAAMAVIVVAALLGFFGHGWLSSRDIEDPASGLGVHYERFLRYRDAAELIVTAPGEAGGDKRLRLWIDADYLEQMRIVSIAPEPRRQEVAPDRVWFIFDVAGSEKPVQIVFRLEPVARGSLAARVGVEAGGDGNADAAGPALSFAQFVYP